MTTLHLAKGKLWQKEKNRHDQSESHENPAPDKELFMAERGTGRDQSECRDRPRVGEGWFVVEHKGLDGKGPCPVTTLYFARGYLW